MTINLDITMVEERHFSFNDRILSVDLKFDDKANGWVFYNPECEDSDETETWSRNCEGKFFTFDSIFQALLYNINEYYSYK